MLLHFLKWIILVMLLIDTIICENINNPTNNNKKENQLYSNNTVRQKRSIYEPQIRKARSSFFITDGQETDDYNLNNQLFTSLPNYKSLYDKSYRPLQYRDNPVKINYGKSHYYQNEQSDNNINYQEEPFGYNPPLENDNGDSKLQFERFDQQHEENQWNDHPMANVRNPKLKNIKEKHKNNEDSRFRFMERKPYSAQSKNGNKKMFKGNKHPSDFAKVNGKFEGQPEYLFYVVANKPGLFESSTKFPNLKSGFGSDHSQVKASQNKLGKGQLYQIVGRQKFFGFNKGNEKSKTEGTGLAVGKKAEKTEEQKEKEQTEKEKEEKTYIEPSCNYPDYGEFNTPLIGDNDYESFIARNRWDNDQINKYVQHALSEITRSGFQNIFKHNLAKHKIKKESSDISNMDNNFLTNNIESKQVNKLEIKGENLIKKDQELYQRDSKNVMKDAIYDNTNVEQKLPSEIQEISSNENVNNFDTKLQKDNLNFKTKKESLQNNKQQILKVNSDKQNFKDVKGDMNLQSPNKIVNPNQGSHSVEVLINANDLQKQAPREVLGSEEDKALKDDKEILNEQKSYLRNGGNLNQNAINLNQDVTLNKDNINYAPSGVSKINDQKAARDTDISQSNLQAGAQRKENELKFEVYDGSNADQNLKAKQISLNDLENFDEGDDEHQLNFNNGNYYLQNIPAENAVNEHDNDHKEDVDYMNNILQNEEFMDNLYYMTSTARSVIEVIKEFDPQQISKISKRENIKRLQNVKKIEELIGKNNVHQILNNQVERRGGESKQISRHLKELIDVLNQNYKSPTENQKGAEKKNKSPDKYFIVPQTLFHKLAANSMFLNKIRRRQQKNQISKRKPTYNKPGMKYENANNINNKDRSPSNEKRVKENNLNKESLLKKDVTRTELKNFYNFEEKPMSKDVTISKQAKQTMNDIYDLPGMKKTKYEMTDKDLAELRNDLEELDRLITSKKIMQETIYNKKNYILSKMVGSNVANTDTQKNQKNLVKNENAPNTHVKKSNTNKNDPDYVQCFVVADKEATTSKNNNLDQQRNTQLNNRNLYIVPIGKDHIMEYIKKLSQNKEGPFTFSQNVKVNSDKKLNVKKEEFINPSNLNPNDQNQNANLNKAAIQNQNANILNKDLQNQNPKKEISSSNRQKKRWLTYEKKHQKNNNKILPNKEAFGFPYEELKNQRKSKISKKDKRNIKENFLNREQQNWQ